MSEEGLEARVSFFKTDKWLFSLMLFSAVISLIASFALSVDALILASDDSQALICDINSVVSCSKVATQWQASLFGFPNAYLGLICEPVVITIAVAGLMGTRFPRAFMAIAQFIYLLGLIFALWLFYQSAFVIHAFCPWCLLVTLCTSITFFTLLRFNILHDNISRNVRVSVILSRIVRGSYDTIVELLLIGAIVIIMILNYGSALFS